MAKWLETRKGGDFHAIAEECGISPILARIIRNRDVIGTEAVKRYLSGSLESLHDPRLLSDAIAAADLLRTSIHDGKRIRVIGDYDVDGISSTYILVTAMRNLGADVSYVLPNRMTDGYGLNERMIDDAIRDEIDLIITCDNGIAASEPIRKAKEEGLSVIVTDHHEIPYRLSERGEIEYILPPADAIVEPKRKADGKDSCLYPFQEICGAVVALKLMQVLYDPDHPDSVFLSGRKNAVGSLFSELLAFASMATICDVMPLQDENRAIVRAGLLEIQATSNPGLKALIGVQGLTGMPITTYHAGFVLGPCLNASGRLDSAERALSLFTDCKDPEEAVRRAGELKELNDSRKTMTEQGLKLAVRIIEEEEKILPKVLVLYLPGCHESIVGIIAGKVKERYMRPAFVLTDAQQKGFLKGSGRSIEGYDMYGEMNKVADVFDRFGGHKMAAGLTIPEDRLSEFRTRINEQCTLTDEDMTNVLHLDMVLPPQFLSEDLVSELGKLEPCGTGNSRPLFACRDILIMGGQVIGKNRNVLKLRLEDEYRKKYQGIWFGDVSVMKQKFDDRYGNGTFDSLTAVVAPGERYGRYSTPGAPREIKAHIAYQPTVNEWRGNRELQLNIADVILL